MRAVDIIMKKRDGEALAREEINFLISGYVNKVIPDYQMSSFAMAVFFRGMSFEETGFLTRAMIDSGEVIDLSRVKGFLVDKHSTGGVGDKVSLILAPLAAACGLKVPMMSGRSLGHTGGTLDKLESIPGYRTDLSADSFIEVVERVGFSMIGQSERVVPADRQMYSLRDVTATVESIPLITASIMSKKFAEGARAFVFDVKCGSGAFMKGFADAERLAVSLVNTGKSLGRRINAIITDMDQPLGLKIGNFLEVREAIECLHGRGPEDLMDLTIRLTGRMLVLSGNVPDLEAAEEECRLKIKDGSAWRKFLENVELQGGDVRSVKEPEKVPLAKQIETLPYAERKEAYVKRIDAYKVGIAAGMLGAGRARKEDPIFPEVGVELLKTQGDPVRPGEGLCLVHCRDTGRVEEAGELLLKAYTFSEESIPPQKRVMKEIVGL